MPLVLKSFADVAALPLPSFDAEAVRGAQARQDSLTKPQGSLGRLEELAVFMAGWRRTSRPSIARAQALIFAGNHGICAQGVNPYPQEVTAQMVANFEGGGASINQLCRVNGAELAVIALDLDRPTADFTQGPAMSEAETIDAMNRGAAAVDKGADVVILGEMGIGNSTIAAALTSALFGGTPSDWVGPGTGSDAEGLARKINAIERGLALHGGQPALETLARLGGREQAALCGAILAARMAHIPVILDGFICTAAASVLDAAQPGALDHAVAGHVSAEGAHRALLDRLGKVPLLDLGLRLGEGSGAVLAIGVLRGALACHSDMATFAEAGVAAG